MSGYFQCLYCVSFKSLVVRSWARPQRIRSQKNIKERATDGVLIVETVLLGTLYKGLVRPGDGPAFRICFFSADLSCQRTQIRAPRKLPTHPCRRCHLRGTGKVPERGLPYDFFFSHILDNRLLPTKLTMLMQRNGY